MNTIIKDLRKLILTISYNAQEGHIPSAFSILDLIWVLYDQVLPIQKNSRFLLSKGQGCLALYAVLAHKNFIDKKELLSNYCGITSDFGGHPDRNKSNLIEASTGSLGHGLPIATGIALAKKDRKEKGNIYCLIGDGEANEGSIWEAALIASHHNLNNLYCIVDNNHSTDRALLMGNIIDKFKAFGWRVYVVDGHNHKDILTAFLHKSNNKPVCIIANTIKGKGCKSMENDPGWHHRSPNDLEYRNFLKEIEEI